MTTEQNLIWESVLPPSNALHLLGDPRMVMAAYITLPTDGLELVKESQTAFGWSNYYKVADGMIYQESSAQNALYRAATASEIETEMNS